MRGGTFSPEKFGKVFFLILSIVLLLVGCGESKTNASDKAISVAQQAIDAVDSYLDGDVDGKRTLASLNKLSDELDYVHDMESSSEKTADLAISIQLTGLHTAVNRDNYDSTSATYKKVKEARNDLAEAAGLKKR